MKYEVVCVTKVKLVIDADNKSEAIEIADNRMLENDNVVSYEILSTEEV